MILQDMWDASRFRLSAFSNSRQSIRSTAIQADGHDKKVAKVYPRDNDEFLRPPHVGESAHIYFTL